MEKQCADSLQCKLPCGGWPGPPGIQSIPSPLCIFITSFLRVSSWHFLNSHCSRNVLCPGWIRWVTWLGPGMHPITFSVTPTYISTPIYIHPNMHICSPIYIALNPVCWNQFVTQFLSSELKSSKVFSVLSVSVSNYGVGQCGLLHVCSSYITSAFPHWNAWNVWLAWKREGAKSDKPQDMLRQPPLCVFIMWLFRVLTWTKSKSHRSQLKPKDMLGQAHFTELSASLLNGSFVQYLWILN